MRRHTYLTNAKVRPVRAAEEIRISGQYNILTAKALGLTIPPVVLMRAEKVIK